MGDIIELHERLVRVEHAVLELQQKIFPERFKDDKEEKKK